jgi:NitT/TauT family transport system permease protein
MVIIGAIALTAEFAITRLENRLLAWRPATNSEASGI